MKHDKFILKIFNDHTAEFFKTWFKRIEHKRLTLSSDRWNHAATETHIFGRIYCKHHWTPFCWRFKRYTAKTEMNNLLDFYKEKIMIKEIFCVLILCIFTTSVYAAEDIIIKLPGIYFTKPIIEAFKKAQSVSYSQMYLTIKTNHSFEPGSVKKVVESYKIFITGRNLLIFAEDPKLSLILHVGRNHNKLQFSTNWGSGGTSGRRFKEMEGDFRKMLSIVYEELKKENK